MSNSLTMKAALEEKRKLRQADRERKLARALVLHKEGFAADTIARRLGIDYRAVKDAVKASGAGR